MSAYSRWTRLTALVIVTFPDGRGSTREGGCEATTTTTDRVKADRHHTTTTTASMKAGKSFRFDTFGE
jgi:hypothetical protein